MAWMKAIFSTVNIERSEEREEEEEGEERKKRKKRGGREGKGRRGGRKYIYLSYHLVTAPTAFLSAATVYGALRGLETFSQLVTANSSFR